MNTPTPTSQATTMKKEHHMNTPTPTSQATANKPVIERPAVDYILNIAEVCAITGLSRCTIYRMLSAQRFPKPGKVGIRRIGWKTSQINAWIESRFNG